MLRDLRDLALRVRDAKSRENIVEAITCYEASAYRASIAGVWTAVVYDLIAKVIELSHQGDANALAFKLAFDKARENNNTDKLLATESSIIDVALVDYQFINRAEKEALERLKSDRNKCAHPAFVSDDQIFQPSNELARYYISMALECVLTKPPIFGKTMLSRYSEAVKGGLFPSERTHAISYVRTNFLEKMRQNFIRNFCIVVAKALLKEMPEDWKPSPRVNITNTLHAISQYNTELWENDWRHEVIKLEEASDTAQRRTFIGLIGLMPSLGIAINQEFVDRARIAIDTYDNAIDPKLDVFIGVRIPALRSLILSRFNALDQEVQARVVKRYPEADYWIRSLENLNAAVSFRGAEGLYDDFVVPFNDVMDRHQYLALLSAVRTNGQIWDAGGTPSRIASSTMAANLTGITAADLVSFRDFLQINRRLESYSEMFVALHGRGIELFHDQDCLFDDADIFS